MKGKTNKWVPWLSSLLIGIIITAALITFSESYTFSTYPGVFLPSPVPSTQVNAISVIDSINEFSGNGTEIGVYDWAREGITLSLILMFVVIPFLYVKGTLQSEKRENPTAVWYIGSALMLVVVIVPLIAGALKFYTYQHTKENSVNNRTQDKMRTELIDISFIVAEHMLELENISELSEFNTSEIEEVRNSKFKYQLTISSEDTSAIITVSSDEINNFTATTSVRPYSDQIFEYQRTF